MINSQDYPGFNSLNHLFGVLRRYALLFFAIAAVVMAPFVYFLAERASQYRIEAFFNLSAETFMRPSEKNDKKEERREAFSQIVIDQPAQKPFVFRVSLSLFKKLTSQLENPHRLARYNHAAGALTPDEFSALERDLRRKGIEAVLRPVYDFAREDLKEVAQLNREDITSVIGIKMIGESQSADQLKRNINFLGRYAQDSLAVLLISDFFLEKSLEAELALSRIENDLMQARFAVAQMEKLRSELKEILERYPGSVGIDSRQVVDIGNGAYRFLSPTVQLVGIESQMAEIRRSIDANEREREKYEIVKKIVHTGRIGGTAMMESGVVDFNKLGGILSAAFDGLDMNSDGTRGAYYLLKTPVDVLSAFIHTNYRFLAEPTPVPKPHGADLFIILVFGVVASVFTAFFVIVVFDFIRFRPPMNTSEKDVLTN